MAVIRPKATAHEALRLTPLNVEEVEAFVGGDAGKAPGGNGLVFAGPDGPIHAGLGWWIIRRVDGSLFSCSPSTFDATYEEVEGS